MEVFDRFVGKNDAVVHLKISFFDFGLFKQFHNALTVIGVKPTKAEFRARSVLIRGDAIYSIEFW